VAVNTALSFLPRNGKSEQDANKGPVRHSEKFQAKMKSTFV